MPERPERTPGVPFRPFLGMLRVARADQATAAQNINLTVPVVLFCKQLSSRDGTSCRFCCPDERAKGLATV